MGFGWSFYGYFLYAPAWILGYFLWARYVSDKESREEAARERLSKEGTERLNEVP